MGKKAQAVIISLWILVILTILAISIGHRVSMALRLSRYQQDNLKALYLAKAGINLAIMEIEKDDKDYDCLQDGWANNEKLFKEISFKDANDGFASVSYIDRKGEVVSGVIDEERKININIVKQALLEVMLDKIGVSNFSEVANNICAWRADVAVTIPDYGDSGYSNKAAKFSNVEEIILVKGVRDIEQRTYEKLKNLITICGSGKVNINTADKELLEILIEYSRRQLLNQNISENNPGDLLERIIEARPFGDINDLQAKLRNQGDLNSGQINILNEVYGMIDFKSSCFYINSDGKIKNVNSIIQCIFDRSNKKIIYWHES